MNITSVARRSCRNWGRRTRIASALQLIPRGQLRVYCHEALGLFVAPVITAYLARYPEVSVDLRTGNLMIDLVQEGFDLEITPRLPSDSTLVRRFLARVPFMLCCAPAYLEKHPAPQSPADLAGHNCLRYAYLFSDEWTFLDVAGNPLAVRVSGNLITTSLEAMRDAAIAGVGLWLTAPVLISDLLASGALVPLLLDYRVPEREIVALYPHRRHMTAKVRAFIDMMVDLFATEQRRLGPASG